MSVPRKLPQLRIKPKMIAAFLAVGLLPLGIVAYLGLSATSDALHEEAFAKLRAVRDIKKDQIERYFVERQNQLHVLVEEVAAMQDIGMGQVRTLHDMRKDVVTTGLNALRGQVRGLAQANKTQQSLQLFTAGSSGNAASETLFAHYDPMYAESQEHGGWHDTLLIDPDLKIVYTLNKADDMGRSLTSDLLAGSPLARAVDAARAKPGEVVLSDFAPYPDDDGKQAAFAVSSIATATGRVSGFVAVRINSTLLDEMVQQGADLGETSETYIVSTADKRVVFRTNLRTMGNGTLFAGKDITSTAPTYLKLLAEGESGLRVFPDSTGNPVLVAFDPLAVEGVEWGIVTKVNLEELLASEHTGQRTLTDFVETFGYYDLFLIGNEGFVFYSVGKEADYHTNLMEGAFAGSNLGHLFRQTMASKEQGLVDFQPYAPSGGAPAGFIAAPLIKQGEVQLVIALQLSIDDINTVMQARSGMGDTGETYLVGPDRLMRSDSYIDPTHHSVAASFANPDQGDVDTAASRAALAGKSGSEIISDYNGNLALSAYTPVTVGDMTWALLAEIDKAEAFAPVMEIRNDILIIAAIGTVAVSVVGFLLARGIAGPVTGMTTAMRSLAGGKLDTVVPAKDRADEIGEMAAAVQVFKDSAIRNKQLEAEQVEAKRRAEEEKRAMMNRLAADFETSVGGIVRGVASASTEMDASAQSMSTTAEQTSRQAAAVAASAEEASANVQTVASSAEELTSSIAEIGRRVAQSSQITGRAVSEAEATTAKIDGLAASARSIGEVVELITEIAEKTNLLALNATIEAARAGEHGKGFAVVASEVKTLANQTAKATDEIAQQITGVQGATREAVSAISSIAQTIRETNEIAAAIAAAVEQQNAATEEIARNVEQVAVAAQDTTSNITGVNEAAGHTGTAATQILGAAQSLSQQAEALQAEVDKFLTEVRAA